MPASEHLAGLAIGSREYCSDGSALGRFLDGRIDLAQRPIEIGDGVSFGVDTSRMGCLRLDGRLYRTPLARMGGCAEKLRLTDPVRLLATTRRAIERIAPDRLKRDSANRTGAKLDPVIAPAVPHVAILARAAGVYAQLSALDTNKLPLALTVPHVAILAKAAGVYAQLSAMDTNKLLLALTVSHVAILAKVACVYHRRFAFGAKALALAVVDKRGGFEHPLFICGRRRGTLLMVVPHIAGPTHTVNEIGTNSAAPWTFCDGRSGTPLMVVAHIASPTHAVDEIGTLSATPWTCDL